VIWAPVVEWNIEMDQATTVQAATIVIRDELLAYPDCAYALSAVVVEPTFAFPPLLQPMATHADGAIAVRLTAGDAALRKPARTAVALATILGVPIESLVDAGLQRLRDKPSTTRAELGTWLLRKIASGAVGMLAAEVAQDLLEHTR
jgi:hypothetical protein